jgi:TonB family protein
MPKVKAALAARWAAALEPRMSEFSAGNMKVAFTLDADGKVTDFTVIANTSNEPFEKFCEQFVRETQFETPPAGALTDGQLEIPFTFTIL